MFVACSRKKEGSACSYFKEFNGIFQGVYLQ